jgi:radical SAM protein with 4Fe4S-binding SPASM domain
MISAAPEAISEVRSRNVALNAREYEQRQIVLQSRPTMVYMELTQNCNLSCRMCRSANTFDRAKNMPDELFSSVIDQLGATASTLDLHGWGESTMLPDFTAKLRAAAATGARLRLVTNAQLITAEQFEVICSSNGVVAVSLDAATPELFAQLGRGDLNRVVANVRKGTAIARQCGAGQVYFNTVVSRYTLHQLADIVALAKSAGVERVVLSPIKTAPDHCADLGDVPSDVREQLSRAAERARQLGVVLQLGAALHGEHVIPEALPTTCSSPWSHALVAYNGDVLFCDHLLNHPEYSMGCLRTTGFDNIWNGTKFQAVRRAHVAAEQARVVGFNYQKCNWCYSRRYMDADAPQIPSETGREVSTRAPGARRLL